MTQSAKFILARAKFLSILKRINEWAKAQQFKQIETRGQRFADRISNLADTAKSYKQADHLQALAIANLEQAQIAYNEAIQAKLFVASEQADAAEEAVLDIESHIAILKEQLREAAAELRVAKQEYTEADKYYATVERVVDKETIVIG